MGWVVLNFKSLKNRSHLRVAESKTILSHRASHNHATGIRNIAKIGDVPKISNNASSRPNPYQSPRRIYSEDPGQIGQR